MRHLLVVLTALLLFTAAPPVAGEERSGLPKCPDDQSQLYDGCFGTYEAPNGDQYVGEWKDDEFNGGGIYTFANADGRYAERSELPKCPDDQNQRYDGCFGTYAAPNGDKYVGEWKDDLSNGNGIYTFANGEMYVGEFKDGKSHGQGTHTWPNGEMYIGEWKDDEPSGSGISRFADGDKYVGEYKNGEFHGQGAYTFADGEKYVGEFEDGERHGQGVRYSPDGAVLEEGYWEDEQLVAGRSGVLAETEPDAAASDDIMATEWQFQSTSAESPPRQFQATTPR